MHRSATSCAASRARCSSTTPRTPAACRCAPRRADLESGGRTVLEEYVDPARSARRGAPAARPPRPDARAARRRPPVGLEPFAGGQRGLDRLPGQLVAEGDGGLASDDHAGSLGLDDDRGILVTEGFGEPAFGFASGRPRGVRGASAPRCERLPTRARTASRTVGGTPVPPAASTSVTKNGFPSCHPVDLCRITLGDHAQPTYTLNAQRLEGHASHGRAGQASEELPQRMAGVDTRLPERQQECPGDTGDPPGEIADRVERRVVCPVDVLDHDDRRTGREDVEQTRQRIIEPLARERLGQLCVLLGHVAERPETARRQQVVAAADDHSDASVHSVEEAAHAVPTSRCRPRPRSGPQRHGLRRPQR